MKIITVTVGPPACGKSTWALNEVTKSGGKTKRVNKDELRAMIDASIFSTSNEKIIEAVRDFAVERFLTKGCNVIVDDTNLHPKHFRRMCELATRIGDVTVVEKHFDVPYNELITRDEARVKKVGKDVIDRMYKKWTHFQKNDPFYAPPHIMRERLELETWKNNKKVPAVIFDIDGTLALHDRSPYDMSLIHTDEPNLPVIFALKLYIKWGATIIIVSGRSENQKEKTKEWLNTHGIPFDEIHMRPADQPTTQDADIKEEIYHTYIEPKYNILAAFDDRNQTVERWRQMGVPTFQVNWGNF